MNFLYYFTKKPSENPWKTNHVNEKPNNINGLGVLDWIEKQAVPMVGSSMMVVATLLMDK